MLNRIVVGTAYISMATLQYCNSAEHRSARKMLHIEVDKLFSTPNLGREVMQWPVISDTTISSRAAIFRLQTVDGRLPMLN